jgi:quercetin dioxygenase-like cupin family protein
MIIKDVLLALENSKHPVAKVIQKGSDFKVIALGFKKGMELAAHKTTMPAKLTVLYGKVRFKQGTQETILDQFEDIDIPVDVMHAVFGIEDALCLLTQGKM